MGYNRGDLREEDASWYQLPWPVRRRLDGNVPINLGAHHTLLRHVYKDRVPTT